MKPHHCNHCDKHLALINRVFLLIQLQFRVLTGNNANLLNVNESSGQISLSSNLNTNVPITANMEVSVSGKSFINLYQCPRIEWKCYSRSKLCIQDSWIFFIEIWSERLRSEDTLPTFQWEKSISEKLKWVEAHGSTNYWILCFKYPESRYYQQFISNLLAIWIYEIIIYVSFYGTRRR